MVQVSWRRLIEHRPHVDAAGQREAGDDLRLYRMLQHTECTIFAPTAGRDDFQFGLHIRIFQLLDVLFVVVGAFANGHTADGRYIQHTVAHLERVAGQLNRCLQSAAVHFQLLLQTLVRLCEGKFD